MDENALSNQIIGAAIEVHRELGPGLLESVYEAALAYELEQCGLPYQRQQPIPVVYKGLPLDTGFRVDLWVNNLIVVELKAVEALNNLHYAQVITYLKLTGCKLGLLLNFNVARMKFGIRRVALDLPDNLPLPRSRYLRLLD